MMFDHRLYNYQDDFDFVSGTLPEALFNLWDQLERAQAILKGRNNYQISQALESLDWMFRRGDELLFKEALASEREQGTFVSRVKSLSCLVDHINISDIDDFPEPSWADYFATLTIACAVEALWSYNNPSKDLPPDIAKMVPNYHAIQEHHQTEVVLEAMDAVGHAERYFALDEAEKGNKKRRQENGRKGGIQRMNMRPFVAVRTRVISIYQERYTQLSNRKAARLIWKHDLTEDEKAIFETDDPQNRLERWIGNHRRSQPKDI